MNIANILIIEFVENIIFYIIFRIFEEVNPAFQIGNNSPFTTPLLPHNSPGRIFVVKSNKETIISYIVLSDNYGVKKQGFIKSLSDCVFIVSF